MTDQQFGEFLEKKRNELNWPNFGNKEEFIEKFGRQIQRTLSGRITQLFGKFFSTKKWFSAMMILVMLFLECGAAAEQNTVDFGIFPANQEKKHKFLIENASRQKLILGKIRSTCSCSQEQLSARELQPGEKAFLETRVKANSLAGKFEKQVYVETNDPQQRFLKFTLKGQAEPLLEISPAPNRHLGLLVVGREYAPVFSIIPKSPDVKLQVKASGNAVPVRTALQSNADGWTLQLRFTPTVPGMLTVKTSLIILAPAGWTPVDIQLSGRVLAPGHDQQQNSHSPQK